jgi:acyl carrier protein
VSKKFVNMIQLTAGEFNISVDQLSLNSKFRELPKWSSLNALLFISKINEETGVLISSATLAEMTTLGDINDFINLNII